jgi:hypothetical protein
MPPLVGRLHQYALKRLGDRPSERLRGAGAALLRTSHEHWRARELPGEVTMLRFVVVLHRRELRCGCRSVGPPPLEAAAGAAKSYLYVPAPNRAYAIAHPAKLQVPRLQGPDRMQMCRNPYAKSLAPPKTPFNDPVPKPDWQGTFNNIVRRQSAVALHCPHAVEGR